MLAVALTCLEILALKPTCFCKSAIVISLSVSTRNNFLYVTAVILPPSYCCLLYHEKVKISIPSIKISTLSSENTQ